MSVEAENEGRRMKAKGTLAVCRALLAGADFDLNLHGPRNDRDVKD